MPATVIGKREWPRLASKRLSRIYRQGNQTPIGIGSELAKIDGLSPEVPSSSVTAETFGPAMLLGVGTISSRGLFEALLTKSRFRRNAS